MSLAEIFRGMIRPREPPPAVVALPPAQPVPNESRDHYARMRAQLRLHEGERLRPYRDTIGKLTIGIGRNLDDTGITRDEADYLLIADILRSERDLDEHLPWWRMLDPIRRRVLVDMCFNMGIGTPGGRGLRSFVNTLEHIRMGRYHEAADGMLRSRWSDQVGARSERLAEMMRSGQDYP